MPEQALGGNLLGFGIVTEDKNHSRTNATGLDFVLGEYMHLQCVRTFDC